MLTESVLSGSDAPRQLVIASTWDGAAIDPSEQVVLQLDATAHELVLRVDAPFHGDPAPPSAVGSTGGLWQYEVVELMLLGDRERYLEVELSPHGHYLVLLLEGCRNVVRDGLRIDHEAHVDGDRWWGCARIPRSWIPQACERLNAYAMHGSGEARRYLAWRPRRDVTPTMQPDFHHLPSFGLLADCAQLGGADT